MRLGCISPSLLDFTAEILLFPGLSLILYTTRICPPIPCVLQRGVLRASPCPVLDSMCSSLLMSVEVCLLPLSRSLIQTCVWPCQQLSHVRGSKCFQLKTGVFLDVKEITHNTQAIINSSWNFTVFVVYSGIFRQTFIVHRFQISILSLST